MPNHRLLLCITLLIIAAVLLGIKTKDKFFNPYPEAATIGQGNPSFDELSKRFTDLAEKKGAVYAYHIELIANLPVTTDTHLLGHAIGDVLYKQKGIAGIADCTQDFRNACSHSIVIGAFEEFGEKALPLIAEACNKAPGGNGAYTMCYHGLGHGVFAHYGYTFPKTVAACKKFGTAKHGYREYTECVGGAVMELMSGGGHDHELWLTARKKYLPSNDPFSPCDSSVIPRDAKGMCFIYATPRFFEFAGVNTSNPDPVALRAAFAICDALPKDTSDLRSQCFGGFGKEFVPAVVGHDVRNVPSITQPQLEMIATWCNSTDALDGRRSCLFNELSSLVWNGENPSVAARFCTLFTNGFKNECFSWLARNLHENITDTAKNKVACSNLPAQYSSTCVRPKSKT